MPQLKNETRVYHVDWNTKRLSSVEILKEDEPAMPEQGLLFSKLFNSGDTVLTAFSTSHPHNKIPEALMSARLATLKWNRAYSMPDFGFDESGVYGNLSFNSKQHFVYVSWSSVVEISGLTSQVSAAWPENEKGETLK